MKRYRVVVSVNAKEDLRRYLRYLKEVKHNGQAAKNVMDDFRATRKKLSDVAGSLADPDSDKLKERGLKRINFLKHNYFILFCIKDDKAIVTNVFHGLEDAESKLR